MKEAVNGGCYVFTRLESIFKTWATLSGIPSDVVEAFMGHISGIKHVYFLAGVDSLENQEVIKILRKEYEKAVPYLTINTSEEDVKRLEEKIEDLWRRQENYEKMLEKLYKIWGDVNMLVKKAEKKYSSF